MAFSPTEAYRLLEKAFHEGRLAHAYLLIGSSREELLSLALRLVNLVNNWSCKDIEAVALKGVSVLEPESKLRQIKVGAVRELEKRFHMTSDHDWKVGIIVDAERQMEQAANAFLKTLEEPPPQSLILLLTTQPEALLDTVRSRCIRVPLFQPGQTAMKLTEPQEEIVEALGRHFMGEVCVPRAMALLNVVVRSLSGIREKIAKQNAAALREELEEYRESTDGSWLRDREDHFSNLTESEYHGERAQVLGVIYCWLGELLKSKADAPVAYFPSQADVLQQVSQKLTFSDLQRRLNAFEEMRTTLTRTTVREALALEVGFIRIFG